MLNLATLRVRCIMPQGTRAFLIHSRKKLRGTGIVDDLASRDMRCSIMRRLTHTWVCKIIQFAWSVDRKIDMKACSAVSGQTLTLVCYNPPTWQSGSWSWLDTLTLSVTGPYLAYTSTGTNGEAQIIHKTQQTNKQKQKPPQTDCSLFTSDYEPRGLKVADGSLVETSIETMDLQLRMFTSVRATACRLWWPTIRLWKAIVTTRKYQRKSVAGRLTYTV